MSAHVPLRIASIALAATLIAVLPASARAPRHHPRPEKPAETTADAPADKQDEKAPPAPRRIGPSFRMRLGLFTPDGDSEFWDDIHNTWTGNTRNLRGFTFGGDVLVPVSPGSDHLNVMGSIGFYNGSQRQSDRSYLDVRHRSTLSITPVTVGVLAYLAPSRAPVRPYLGGGVGLYWYRYRESGDFYDYANEEVVNTDYTSDGWTGGAYALAGLDVQIVPRHWGLFFEARRHWASTDIGGDFDPPGGKIDLGGWEGTTGMRWSF